MQLNMNAVNWAIDSAAIQKMPEEIVVFANVEMTISDFFRELMCQVWMGSEERPFIDLKDPTWRLEVLETLVQNGIVGGTLDEYGRLETCDYEKANAMIVTMLVECM